MKFNAFSLENLEISFKKATLQGNFTVITSSKQAVRLDKTDTLKKMRKTFTKWIIAGDIPIPVVIEMDVNVLCKYSLSVDASVNKQVNFQVNNMLDLGILYQNSTWANSYNLTKNNTFSVVQNDGITGTNINFSIIPDISFKFYGVVGPKASLAIRSNFNGNLAFPSYDWDFGVGAGLETTVGVEATIFGKQIVNYNKTINSDTLKYSTPYSLVKVSGDNQSGIANSALPQPLKVQVLDSKGIKQPNVPIYFSVKNGAGSVSAASLKTDADGYAQISWTLGSSQAAIQFVEVSAKKANGTPLVNAPLDFAAANKPIAVGDSYAGGTVFYIDGTGQHGLVWALVGANIWDVGYGLPPSPYNAVSTGATGSAIGTGRSNTNVIVGARSMGAPAANDCINFRGSGYGDWYLPSLDEAKEIVKVSLLPGARQGFIWTSTETGSNTAMSVGGDYGPGGPSVMVSNVSKVTNCGVFGVRAF